MKKSKRILSLLLAACLLATPLISSVANAATVGGRLETVSGEPTGTLRAGELTVENHENPLGVDIAQPNLAWKLTSDGRNQAQTKYRILVASSAEKLADDEGDLWDTTVESDKNSCILYGGVPLNSRQRVYWKVMVWDANGRASAWSETAWWEMAFTEPSDWTASWIGKDVSNPSRQIITNSFGPVSAQFVRLKVNEVGLRAAAEAIQRLQFMEWEIYGAEHPSVNLAAGKAVSSSNQLTSSGSWSASCLTDGLTDGSHGYSTGSLSGTDLSADPVYVTIDLGEPTEFDTFKLYGRTDAVSIDEDLCPNYPKQYEIEISDDGEHFTPVQTVSIDRASAPRIESSSNALPLFAKEFEVDLDRVASARLYITGLGLYEARINGQNIADSVFDPGETDFQDRVMYVTYDVKDFLKDGGNAIGVQLGNGMYNVGSTPGRYQKHDYKLGEDKLLAQLEITGADGSVQTIVSDASWKQADGPITFSSWYGGEDYDATKELPGWAEYGADRSGWKAASVVSSPTQELSARNMPPLRVQREITPVGVSQLDNGDYVIDMGVNFAGTYDMVLTGLTEEHRGTKIEMWPSELLKEDGSVDQGATGSPIWDSYVVKGTGEETFHLTFMYHGFRYLQVKNCPVELTADNFRGYFIRTDNEKVGTFETSSDTLNQINDMINVSVESNMYNTLTDCPHREKLGWLEVSHLMYYSMAYNFDIQSWMKKITLDMTESQLENGMMPSIAPEYPVFSGGFRSDPTWGGAAILDPWYTYQVYGDDSLLEIAYPMMASYIDYIKTQSTDNLINFGLGDWGGYDTSTPLGLVVSATYYNLADVMSQIADKLGKTEDAQGYRDLAAAIKVSFNEAYYHPETGQYGSGSQASNACPLFAGLVPDDEVDRVLDNLVANIESRGWHLSTGEVGLRQMFVVLGKYGRSDVVYKMATNKTMPSYWYFIENGRTSLPEFWDMNASQNHCMMGHIQEWFYRYLAGIDHSSPGYKTIVIKPYLPDDLERVKASTMTSYGRITSEWNHDLATGRLTMHADIPVGTTADLYVPALGRSSNTAVINGQTAAGTLEGDYILFKGLGSGSYDVVREPAGIVSVNASIDQQVLEIGEIAEYAGIARPSQITLTALTDEGDSVGLAPKAASYAVDNSDIVRVDQETGSVIGLKDGNAVITVTCGEFTQTLSVQVNTTKVISLQAKPSKPALNYVGDEVRIQITGTIDSGNQIDLTGYNGVVLTSESEEITIRPAGSVLLSSRGTVGDSSIIRAEFGDISSLCTILNGDAQNLARAEGTAVRSSSYTLAAWGDYSNESAVDGDKTGNRWGSQGGWSDGDANVWPDWYQVDFGSVKTISAVDLTFLQDNFGSAGNPTLETKTTKYGMSNYKLEYWDGSDWQTIADVSGNEYAWSQVGFNPVTTNRLRVVFDAQENGSNQARIVEIEVWEASSPADTSVPVTVNGEIRDDLATAVTAENSFTASFDDQKLLNAVNASEGPVVIQLDAAQNKPENNLELRSETLAAMQGRDVTFVLKSGVQSVTATAEKLYNQEAISRNTIASSKAEVMLRLKIGEAVTGAIRYTNFVLTEELELTPVVETNKKILQAVLDYAAAAIESGQVDSLIPTVQTLFMNSFDNAASVCSSTASTQAQVDSAWKDLMKAIHMLSFQAGDKTRLNQLIEAASGLNPDDYTNAGAFVDALHTAKSVLGDPDALAGEVDQAADALESAMEALILKEWDGIRSAVAYAETVILENYVAAGQDAFVASLQAANEVLGNPKSSQQEIDSAEAELLDALLALRLKADKSLLEQFVNQMKEIDLTCYTSVSVEVFQAAFREAEELLRDETLTQREDQEKVDKVLSSLEAAYADLQRAAGNVTASSAASKPAATGDFGGSIALVFAAAALSALVLKKKRH